jgi:phospholipid/cholesterol/gamma-HCH transport system substrate-binding protein
MKRAIVLLAVLALGGCTTDGLAGLPLPGGAPGGRSYDVVVEFSDVLDLVPQSAVKVNDVTVGSVEKVWLSGWTARVKLRVDADVRLPDNATAAIRQTSLLGEKFVALQAPTGEAPEGQLSDGDVLPLSRTTRSAEVEEVLGALGLLLNGGGLAQLKTINQELGTALDGRTGEARDALGQLTALIAGLDKQKADIVRAIDSLDRLSAHLAQQKETVGTAVESLGPGLAVLADQRAQLTSALTALGKLGKVGNRVITASRDDVVADIKALRPILDQLTRAGDALPKSLDFLLTYPFPPNITGAIVGDAVNLRVTADLNASDVLANLLASAPPAAPGTTGKAGKGGATRPGKSGTAAPVIPRPSVSVPGLTLPTALPCLSGLPTPTPLPTLYSCDTPLPGASGLPGAVLPTLPGLPIALGSAPLGAAEGTQGGLDDLLIGGTV